MFRISFLFFSFFFLATLRREKKFRRTTDYIYFFGILARASNLAFFSRSKAVSLRRRLHALFTGLESSGGDSFQSSVQDPRGRTIPNLSKKKNNNFSREAIIFQKEIKRKVIDRKLIFVIFEVVAPMTCNGEIRDFCTASQFLTWDMLLLRVISRR